MLHTRKTSLSLFHKKYIKNKKQSVLEVASSKRLCFYGCDNTPVKKIVNHFFNFFFCPFSHL